MFLLGDMTRGELAAFGGALVLLLLAGGRELYAARGPAQTADLPVYSVGTLAGVVAPTSTLSRLRCVYLYGEDRKHIVAILRADDAGRFGTTLVPGIYYLDTRYPPLGAQATSLKTSVRAGTTTLVSLTARR